MSLRGKSLQLLLLMLCTLLLWAGGVTPPNASSAGTPEWNHNFNYVPLGDSYSVGQSVPRRDNWPHQLVNRLATNDFMYVQLSYEAAVEGYTSQQVIDEELPSIAHYKPDLITLQIGTNDILHHVSASAYRRHLEEIIKTIHDTDPAGHLVLVTIPDMSLTPKAKIFDKPDYLRERVKKFNSVIKAVGEKHNLPVADIFPASQAVAKDHSLISRDGFHFSATEYSYWVDVISQTIVSSHVLAPGN